MAVTGRILNSTTPFSLSQTDLKGADQGYRNPGQETEDNEGKGSKVDLMECLNPMLTKVLTQGTAQVGEGPLNCWKDSPFIAQAECETQESQEFSPSCSERPYHHIISSSSEQNNVVRTLRGGPAQLTPRKKPRKRQKRKEKKKEEEKESRKPRQRRRVPSGVPEQESVSSPLTQVQEEVSESQRRRNINNTFPQSPEVQDTGPPRYTRQDYSRGPGCVPLGWAPQVCDPLSGLPPYGPGGDSDSSCSSVGDCTLALAGLRGSVSQGDQCFAGPFSKDVERDARTREAEDGELSALESDANEGIIFNENIQPVDYEYREEKEYSHDQYIKGGSYGDVYRTRDRNTGYSFASKKIPLKIFNSDEVGTWSVLKSPRVVELFGVVREGPYVLLFMELKSGSVGQLLAERGRLPEDVALHYHGQVLTALEHLHKRRVVHLDIKVDNVLLSEDGMDTFLCDFGQSERLDSNGQSVSASRNLKGTETHMAPEVVKGQPHGAKADVWSSCCMLLHMLTGCPPWTRYYPRPLYLKIANEPPPLREIPPDCSPLTAEVIKAGLHKEPIKRASASDLKTKTTKALRAVGGLRSPVRGSYKEPLQKDDHPLYSLQPSASTATSSDEQPDLWELSQSLARRRKEPDEEEDDDDDDDDGEEEEEEVEVVEATDEGDKTSPTGSPLSSLTPIHDWPKPHVTSTVSELELRKLERDFYLSSLSQLHSAEIQEQLLSCLSSECHSNRELGDKKDSGRWSISPGDYLSSGVFSYNSQPEQVFSMDWLGHTHLPPPRCFEGVDVCIRDFNGCDIQIRESRRVKVGHIATGISDQISERVFTMETQEGQPVLHDEEVLDSGIGLRCVPAPEYSRVWTWRIRDGVLETRD